MPFGPVARELAARWQRAPAPTLCAALADALAKQGEWGEARRILRDGQSRFPGFLPLLVVRARVALAAGDRAGLQAALREAVTLDPEHPMVRAMAEIHSPELLPKLLTDTDQSMVFAAEAEIQEVGPDEVAAGERLITQSLADLYRRQGHLEQARRAYAELLARDPTNPGLASRHGEVQELIAAARPLPFDARESGGLSVRDWLHRLSATSISGPTTRATSFDAFFESPPAPASATTDFDAFQRWLQELET